MPKARSQEVIRRHVHRLLDNNTIIAPPVPVEEIARSLGARVKYMPYEGELAGMLVRSEGRIAIGVNSLHHPNRQRFTMAHEIGHLVLHDDEGVHIDRSFKRDALSAAATDPKEIEANRFAAELLMPFNMIMQDAERIDIEDEDEVSLLARRYQVSFQAMTHRLSNLFFL